MGFPPLQQTTRDRLTGRFGTGVAGWLDGLPGRAALLAREWGVTLGEPPRIDGGSTSVVVHGRLADGRAAVLKLTPDPALAAAESDALLASARGTTDGSGGTGETGARSAGARDLAALPPLPLLLARDDRAGALLLEAVEPGTALSARPEPPGVEAVGALLRRLRAIDPPAGLPPLRERVAFCFDLFERRLAASAGTRADAEALARGRALALRLADEPAAPRAFVHGDLHPGNVLDGGPERGLVAIDPRPCAGDPGFDAVDLTLWAVTSAEEIEQRIATVATAAGYDRARLRAWCDALAPLSPSPPPT